MTLENLKKQRTWVLHRHANGKGKIPTTTTGINAGCSPEHSLEWVTYERARAAVDQVKADGVSLIIRPGYFFIDIDHRSPDDPVATDIMARVGSYAELSLSGNGIHIYGLCDPAQFPTRIKNGKKCLDDKKYYVKHGDIEVYIGGLTNKAAAFTGEAIQGGELTESTEGLMVVLDKYMQRNSTPTQGNAADVPALVLSNQEDIEDAATDIICELGKQANGEKFKRLFNVGDIGDYGSQSEADVALCALIAYRTGANYDLIDHIFRESALYRSKWDREDYRAATMEKGVEACRGVFHYSLVRPSRAEIVDKLKGLRAAFRMHDDMNTARLFVAIYGDRHIYCPEWRSWVQYDGQKLVKDTEGVGATQSMKEFVEALLEYAVNGSGLTGENDTKYKKYAASLGDYRPRKRILDDAKSEGSINATEFDSNTNLFNCLNGTLDLAGDIVLRPHDPRDMITKIAPVEYDPRAQADRWLDFLDEVLEGDKGKIRYLQKYAGLSLTGDTSNETMVILYGATTRNGKSTYVETLLHLMGDYALTIRPETLANKKGRDGNHASSDIARLKGARLVSASEPPKGMLFDAAQLKAMTGRDTITARRLYQDEIEFTPQFKLIMNTNYLPQIGDPSLFSSGRVNVVTFDRHFEEHEQDKELKDKLRTPAELSGILNWCLAGLRLYRKEGLRPPKCVVEATSAYKEQSDRISEFINDVLEEVKDGCLTAKTVYDVYAEWSRKSGYATEGKQTFFRDLKDRNLMMGSKTINGKTVKNVVPGYQIATEYTEYGF